jgi:predicted MFS family arabinose efflux permease
MEATNRSLVPHAWIVTAAAATLLAVTMGQRSALGLFVSPLNTATGLGLATISFAMAMSQIVWGAAQPVAGGLADRYGPAKVISVGAVLLAAATAILPAGHGTLTLVGALSLGAAAGAATGSNAMLLGIVSRRVAAERRGLMVGVVSAGGSAGQLVLAPVAQTLILLTGWANAMYALAALSLLALPLARVLEPRSTDVAATSAGNPPAPPVAAVLGDAVRSKAYWLISAGFFVCGFHVAFLLAHMPGVIELCGLPSSLAGIWIAVIGLCNVVGSIVSGLAIRRVPMKWMLAALYAARAAGVAAFVVMPKTETTLMAFALWMGLTYMATLPPTSGLLGKLFGVERLAPLLGVTMLVHQVGSFLGVWLGGVAVAQTGSYDVLWVADAALAVVAALLHLPLGEPANERAPGRSPAVAAAQALPSAA